MDDARWIPVGDAASLPALSTFKHEGQQLCIVRTDENVYAIDNRCPHEGYPLASGDLKGCALTCAWHNWKFDVASGDCTLGGEGVRTYPVRTRDDGVLEVDVADPDPATVIPPLLASLEEGLLDHDNGRVVRDGVRLVQAGYAAGDLLAKLASFDAERAEYGSTHVLALAADCGRMLERYPGADALYPVAPVMDLAGESQKNRPPRTLVAPVPAGTLESFRVAVEGEDAPGAEALLLGALERSDGPACAEDWLFDAVSRHFLDFGHSAIYAVKLFELIGRTGDPSGWLKQIAPGLLFKIVLGTREDTLPYMKAWFEGVDDTAMERLASLRRPDTRFDPLALRDVMLDGSFQDARAALWAALEAGVAPDRVARALVGAAAHRLWRFDLAHEFDPGVAENWLWATHRFTFASAARQAIERWPSPQALRYLFQAAAFIHTGRGMDAETATLPDAVDADAPQALISAVADKDPARAVGTLRGWIESGRPLDDVERALEDLSLSDPAVRPIVVAHVIKTLLAAFDEWRALEGHPDRAWPLYAAVRFIASPVKERRVNHLVGTSIAWVAEGRMPKKLTQ